MKALFLVVLLVVVVSAGVKAAGGRLPIIDYPIGRLGVEGRGPGMPDAHIEAPGFDEFPAP